MKFGLMTQLQIARPSEPHAELNAYRNLIEQAVAGEAAGFDYYWLTENDKAYVPPFAEAKPKVEAACSGVILPPLRKYSFSSCRA